MQLVPVDHDPFAAPGSAAAADPPDIEVRSPDGTIFAFPAGTSQETMRGALERHYGQQGASAGASAPPMPGSTGEDWWKRDPLVSHADAARTVRLVPVARDTALHEASAGHGDAVPALAALVAGPEAAAAALGTKAAIRGGSAAVGAARREADIARNRELARAVTLRQSRDLDRILDIIGARVLRNDMARHAGRAAEIGSNAALRSQAEQARSYLPASPFAFAPGLP